MGNNITVITMPLSLQRFVWRDLGAWFFSFSVWRPLLWFQSTRHLKFYWNCSRLMNSFAVVLSQSKGRATSSVTDCKCCERPSYIKAGSVRSHGQFCPASKWPPAVLVRPGQKATSACWSGASPRAGFPRKVHAKKALGKGWTFPEKHSGAAVPAVWLGWSRWERSMLCRCGLLPSSMVHFQA